MRNCASVGLFGVLVAHLLSACGGNNSDSGGSADTASLSDSQTETGSDSADSDEEPDADAVTETSRDDVSVDTATPDSSDTLDVEPDTSPAELLRRELDPARCAATDDTFWPAEVVWGEASGESRYSPLSAVLRGAGVEAVTAGEAYESLLEARRLRRAAALVDCGDDRGCLVEAFDWSASDVTTLTEALGADLSDIEPLRNFVATRAGWPWAFDEPENVAFVSALVTLNAELQNPAVARAVSEISLDLLPAIVSALAAESLPVDREALALAVALLDAVDRDEAWRYGAHGRDENAAVAARVSAINFDDFPYAAILVPGQGPTDAETAISPLSIERADFALQRYAAGLAPLILTSGGHVHPDRTTFAEALEMRRRLIDVHGLPASAVAVEPYARHTTTNLRNAARLLHSLGVPLNKPILVTSDVFQSVYIAAGIAQRSRDELGYVPWRTLTQLGPNDSCVFLTPDSLRLDPTDVLDP